jgi:hypothetical protein
VLQQKDTASTVYDDDAREPIAQVARAVVGTTVTTVELKAQASWNRALRTEWQGGGQGGVSEGADGYLVFRVGELEKKGITLQRGDRIISVAGRTTDLYLLEELPAAHLDGKSRTQHWDFEDYQPAKGTA